MTLNPYQQYQTTQVQTASTGDLILLLYDGAIRFLSRADLALEEKRFDNACADLLRGQEIVLELTAGLDMERGGELAGNLRDLYLYIYSTLVDANVKRDRAAIQTAIGLLDNVRGAWRAVVSDGAPSPAKGVMAA